MTSSAADANNGQFRRQPVAVEKLLGLCLTREKLLLIEKNTGADFGLLKQTLPGFFVRVPVEGRPMLAVIKSVEDSCQIEWARFERQLFLPRLGYFDFNQVDTEMPGRDEMERWCQRSEQNALALFSMTVIDTKLTLLRYATRKPKMIILEAVQTQPTIGTSAPPVNNNAIQGKETNVEGLVQSRELLAQVLLPCKDFLKFFSFCANSNHTKMLTFYLTDNLLAFRIGDEENSTEIIVDEITSVEPNLVYFRVYGRAHVSQLVAVDDSEITDQVFDQWHRQLTSKNKSVPNVQAKYQQKMQAIGCLISKLSGSKSDWAMQILEEEELPDISLIIVTAGQVQLLANNLELDELNQVLADCFVVIKMNEYVLELKNQPSMHDRFVVPITSLDKTKQEPRVKFSFRIPIRNQKTGEFLTEVGLQNLGEEKLMDTDKLVVQSLLMIRELNIPATKYFGIWLPNDGEIVRKSAQLDDALAKALKNSEKQQFPPGPPIVPPKMLRAASQPVQHHGSAGIGTNNGQQQQMQQNRRRSNSTDVAGHATEEYGKKRRNNLP